MAIILDSIVGENSRPALRFENEQLVDPQNSWDGRIATSAQVIEHAARAVARVEIEGGVLPWVGTAFLVAPRLAITARYVGLTIPERTFACLNFADNPTAEDTARVAITAIEEVHPYWQFSFLRLAENAPAAPLELAEQPTAIADLTGREIVVIGYSGFDRRNDDAVQSRIFANLFNVKRASPGKVLGAERHSLEGPLMLTHDASTLGGSGGAPLVELATGDVLGIEIGGQYLIGNQAACAWEAYRDPQWRRIWTGTGEILPASPAPSPSPPPRQIFDFDEINEIHQWLIDANVTDEDTLQTLFIGLSPELMGSVPSAKAVSDRLLLALNYLNDTRKWYGDRRPLYYVLTNARRRRPWETDALAAMDVFLERVTAKK